MLATYRDWLNGLKETGINRDIGELIVRSGAEHSVGTKVLDNERSFLISGHSIHDIAFSSIDFFVHPCETWTTL